MHDIVKHKECGWINELYKRGKQLIKFITGHTRVNYFYGTYSKLQLLKLAKTRFASYYLTFRVLVKVSLAWWNIYGGGTPQLQRLATRVLSQVVNTSSAERC
jgi:hypothetical protein